MKSGLFIILLFIASVGLAQENGEVAKVLVIKGDAFIKGKEAPLTLGSPVNEGDVLITKGSTLLKVRFLDNTLVSLGPNSMFKVSVYKIKNGKRKTVYNFLRGKIRAHVKEKRKEGETIVFSNAEVALGVRGTEILANSYLVKGAPSTDVMLTKGVVEVNTSKLGTAVKSYSLTPGKALNTNLIRENGIGSIKSISSKSLELIASSDEFLPALQNSDGSFVDLDSSISKSHGVTSKEDPKKEQPAPKVKEVAKKIANTSVKGVIAGGFRYILKNEPWDIRDAVMNSDKNRADNKCFYYYYKTIPGSGEYERFRRERDCDEFENDL